MTEYLCSNCQSSISKTAVRCPYCGVLLSGTRNLSASEQAHISDRAKEYQDTYEKQKREKQQELDNKRYIENKKSKIDKISSIFHNLEKEPDLFKTLGLKSAFRKLIKIFLEDENEEVKGWALATINNSFHNHFIDKKIIHEYLISIQPYLIEILKNPINGASLKNTAINSLGKIGSDQDIDAIMLGNIFLGKEKFDFKIFEFEMQKKLNNLDAGFSNYKIDSMEGYDFERLVSEMFIKLGFSSEVTKPSGDYGVDVIAQKSGVKFGIQVKRSYNPISIKAVQEIVAGLNYYNCNKGIIVTNNVFTKAAIELATKNQIQLWDRNNLLTRIEEALHNNN